MDGPVSQDYDYPTELHREKNYDFYHTYNGTNNSDHKLRAATYLYPHQARVGEREETRKAVLLLWTSLTCTKALPSGA